MADVNIAGIMRAGVFSPNHIGNDATIFNMVADQLRKRGCIVNIYSEEHFIANSVDEDVIINMCRRKQSIELLKKYEDGGRLVINSGYGIENCVRERLYRLFTGIGIPSPASIVVRTNESVRAKLEKGGFNACWIKRADSHSMHNEDVSFCRHIEEAQEVVQEFFLRGIRTALISRHIEGDEIKFYGIKGQKFFVWEYSSPIGISRKNADADSKEIESELKKICSLAAEELGVFAYGGECIVDSDGKINIVDFNDWPSYASCRKKASVALAKAILEEIKIHNSK